MNEPFKGFWNRLHSFVANVEVSDAMSEEEKCMILSVCNDQTEVKNLAKPDVSGSLPSFADWLSENYYETQNGRFAKKGDHSNDEFIALTIADVYEKYKLKRSGNDC